MHRPVKHEFVYSRDQKNFPIVVSGSLCAGERDRIESIPRSYNIIEIDENGKVRVHVRVKDNLAEPWRDCATFGKAQERKSYYEFGLRRHLKNSGVGKFNEPDERQVGPSSTPFKNDDARLQSYYETNDQYIWLEVSSRSDTDKAQVIVGTRGSGKTSLLATLTPYGRLHHAKYLESAPLRRIAFIFPLRVHQLSGLKGRGWIPVEERNDLFRAILGIGLAKAFIECFEDIIKYYRKEEIPNETSCCKIICSNWFLDLEQHKTFRDITRRLNGMNASILGLYSEREAKTREQTLSSLSQLPIISSGLSFLVNTAEDLSDYSSLEKTHWIAAFDEAEFLSSRQQGILYNLLGQSSKKVGIKIATLPYAHSKAINHLSSPIVHGDDYEEVPISLSYARTAKEVRASADEQDEIDAKAHW